MNILTLKRSATISVPGFVTRQFTQGESVYPNEPYYLAIKWADLGNDTGVSGISPDPTADAPGAVVVSAEDPNLAPGSIWIQKLGNGNYTIWEEDGN